MTCLPIETCFSSHYFDLCDLEAKLVKYIPTHCKAITSKHTDLASILGYKATNIVHIAQHPKF